jgi:colicin import membrane protein
MDSFAVNSANIKDEIETKAADRIDFTNKERLERKSDYDGAAAKVAADKKAVADEVAADKAAVDQVQVDRKVAVDRAAERVKKAKENAEALVIKAKQAEQAAALGRKVGNIEGADAAKHAWADYKSDVAGEKKADALAAARKKIADHEAAVRAAVEKKTQTLKQADDAWVAKEDRAASLAKAKSAAAAAVKETAIEGAEGMKNRMTDEKADMAELHYKRIADAAQARIDAASSGSWPVGDWPEGPGDAPIDSAIDTAAWGGVDAAIDDAAIDAE